MSVIIKGIRLKTAWGVKRTIRHVQNGAENESVAFLQGTPTDISDMHRDAAAHGALYAVRHWIVAPQDRTTRGQMNELLAILAEEFEFDPARAAIIEHRKKRATDDAFEIHWHILVGEVDPATGRILKSSFDRVKHELIARISEFKFGHPFVLGKHTKTVIKGLRSRKLDCIADGLEAIFDPEAPLPAEAFNQSQHQEKKRLGHDLPAVRQLVKRAANEAKTGLALKNRLMTAGLHVKAGNKPGTWIVVNAADAVLIGALHRLAGKRKSEIDALMTEPLPDSPQQIVPSESSKKIDKNEAVPQSPEGEPAVSSVQQVFSKLEQMERSAWQDLKQPIPPFEPSKQQRETVLALREAHADFDATHDRRFDLERQLASAPAVRWWCHLVGVAKRRSERLETIKAELQELQAELRLKELAISAARLKEVRAEKAAKDAYAAIVVSIAERHKAARHHLAVIEQARAILEVRPDIGSKGFDTVLAFAKARLQRQNDAARQLIELGS